MSEHYYRNLEFLNIIEMNKIRFMYAFAVYHFDLLYIWIHMIILY